MVHRTLSKAVLFVFDDSTFEERKVLKALYVIFVATESTDPRPGTCLLRVASSFDQEIVAARADFGYLGAGMTAVQIEVLLFTKSIFYLTVELKK